MFSWGSPFFALCRAFCHSFPARAYYTICEIKTTGKEIKAKIKKIRKEVPNVVIRTTLIAGFPGETEEEFNELKEFVKETKFDRLGCFAYSKEDGTPAVKLDGHLLAKEKKKRANEIMIVDTVKASG